MTSLTTLSVGLCILAITGAVHGVSMRGLKAAPCPAGLCDDVARTDPEKNLRRLVNDITNTVDLCTCHCGQVDSLLHQSIDSNCVVCADLLLNGPLNCNEDVRRNSWSPTPLHQAAQSCNSVMTNVFLDAGAVENSWAWFPGVGWNRPICIAARQDNPNCAGVIRDIAAKGGNLCLQCGGQYPYYLAEQGNQIVQDVIEQDGGKPAGPGGPCPA